MRTPILILLILAGSSGPMSAQTGVEEHPEWRAYFDSAKVHGCFLLSSLRGDRMQIYNAARADSAFLPASTFKIFNSMAALDAGAVRDENDTIRWDGVERQIASWNADQNMRSAIRFSTVWFYQELARRIGPERMQDFITRTHYGNEDISGGIDRFWLDGGLRITPRQQIDFLVRLYRGDLPFSSRAIATVKDITTLEQTAEYTLHGKTGWSARVDHEVGWFVGWLERGDDVWFFANCIDINSDNDIGARIGITRAILHNLGLIEP